MNIIGTWDRCDDTSCYQLRSSIVKNYNTIHMITYPINNSLPFLLSLHHHQEVDQPGMVTIVEFPNLHDVAQRSYHIHHQPDLQHANQTHLMICCFQLHDVGNDQHLIKIVVIPEYGGSNILTNRKKGNVLGSNMRIMRHCS